MRYSIRELVEPFRNYTHCVIDTNTGEIVTVGTEEFLKSLVLTKFCVDGMYIAFFPPKPTENNFTMGSHILSDIEAP